MYSTKKPYSTTSQENTNNPDKTTIPSDTQVAFPKLTFVYLETISVITSVPPVLKLVLYMSPYPIPVRTPPNIAITSISTSSNLTYGTRYDVKYTRRGKSKEPTKAFLAFFQPRKI